MRNDKEQLENMVFGRTTIVDLPSGRMFKICEQNGEHDELLSDPTTQDDLTNIDNFLYSLIVCEVLEGGKEKKVSMDEIKKFLINDRTALLVKSRIFSIGKEIYFNYTWPDGTKQEYVEDLSNYVREYNKPITEEELDNLPATCIPSYPKNAYADFEFSFEDKVFRFNLLNREGELYLLGLERKLLNRNAEYRSRNLRLLDSKTGDYVKVESFRFFNKRVMNCIMLNIDSIDKAINITTTIEHPKDSSFKIDYPILRSPDFFFPAVV
jgi:hypothetical protein